MGQTFCPNCEQPVNVQDRFCDVCNTPLERFFPKPPASAPDQSTAVEDHTSKVLATLSSATKSLLQDQEWPPSSKELQPEEPSLNPSEDPGFPAQLSVEEPQLDGQAERDIPPPPDAVPNQEQQTLPKKDTLDSAAVHEGGSDELHEPPVVVKSEGLDSGNEGIDARERNKEPVAERPETLDLAQPLPQEVKPEAPQPVQNTSPAEPQDYSNEVTMGQHGLSPQAESPKNEPKTGTTPAEQMLARPSDVFFIPPPPPTAPQNDSGAQGSNSLAGASGGFFSGALATPEDIQLGIDQEVIQTCKRLVRQGYQLYGLFGRPSTGKSSLIYALRHHFTKGDSGYGGYATEGDNWDHLAMDLEDQWQSRQVPTADKLHPYLALHPRGGKHIALLDIAGERFEGIQSWTDEIFEFFGLYLGFCKGFFILIELDDLAGAVQIGHDASARIQSQMARIVRFLAVAAQLKKMSNVNDIQAKRAAAADAVNQTGKMKVKVPVAICLSKADKVGSMQFGPALGKIVPGSLSPQSDPWNVLQAIWPEHMETLLNIVPHLKVDWLSCLGTHFEAERQFTGSIGLQGAFQHVITNPPPKWAPSTKNYLKYQKWLGL